jgi:hypothetical protein
VPIEFLTKRPRIARGGARRAEGSLTRHDSNENAPSKDERSSTMTARRFAINVLIFVAVIIVMTALAIWLHLGPVASSAA